MVENGWFVESSEEDVKYSLAMEEDDAGAEEEYEEGECLEEDHLPKLDGRDHLEPQEALQLFPEMPALQQKEIMNHPKIYFLGEVQGKLQLDDADSGYDDKQRNYKVASGDQIKYRFVAHFHFTTRFLSVWFTDTRSCGVLVQECLRSSINRLITKRKRSLL